MNQFFDYFFISPQLVLAFLIGVSVFVFIRPVLMALMGYVGPDIRFPWWVRLADERPVPDLVVCKNGRCGASNYSIAILCQECSNFLLGKRKTGFLRWLGITLFRLSFFITGVLIGFLGYVWPGKVIIVAFSLLFLFMLLRWHTVLSLFLLFGFAGVLSAYIWLGWDIFVLTILAFFPMFSNWQTVKFCRRLAEDGNTKVGSVGLAIPAAITFLSISVIAFHYSTPFSTTTAHIVDAIPYSGSTLRLLVFAFFSSALVVAISNSLLGGVGSVRPIWDFNKRKPSTEEFRLRLHGDKGKDFLERTLITIRLFLLAGALQLRYLTRITVFYLQKAFTIFVNVLWINAVRVLRHIKNVIEIVWEVVVDVVQIAVTSLVGYARTIVFPAVLLWFLGYLSLRFGDYLYSYINFYSIPSSTSLIGHVFFLSTIPLVVGFVIVFIAALLLQSWWVVLEAIANALGKFALADGSLCFFFSNIALITVSHVHGGPYSIGVFTILNGLELVFVGIATKAHILQSQNSR